MATLKQKKIVRHAQKQVHTKERTSGKDTGVGLLMKHARLAHGETLGSVSKVLHIREVYLRAIEEDRIQDLPKEMSYSIGFLKAYAQFLALDTTEIVATFKKQHMPVVTPTIVEPQEDHAREESVDMVAPQHDKEATHFLMGWVFFAAVFIMLLMGRETMPLPESVKNALDTVANLF
jgi:cytoskeletal protein RodZ